MIFCELIKPFSGKDSVNSGYELTKRPYLGPTSTDNDLAFLMVKGVW